MAAAFDQPTLETLLGPGGFGNLQGQLTLRGGDFSQGVTIAQQAIPRLPREAARVLQNALAWSYTSKGIELANHADYVCRLLSVAEHQCKLRLPELELQPFFQLVEQVLVGWAQHERDDL